DEALGEGRGVIYATCHLGPWERMAALLSGLGYPITTIARSSYDARFHTLVYDRLRRSRNVETIYRTDPQAPFAVVRALRRVRVVGFVVDLPNIRRALAPNQGAANRYHPVSWLGHASLIARGPARLALRTGVPVVVGTPAPATREAKLCVHIAKLPTSDLHCG